MSFKRSSFEIGARVEPTEFCIENDHWSRLKGKKGIVTGYSKDGIRIRVKWDGATYASSRSYPSNYLRRIKT